jgi:hypothetical protein
MTSCPKIADGHVMAIKITKVSYSMWNPRAESMCRIIHAEFARMLTCKLAMQSVRTSMESARTNMESVRTNTESVQTNTESMCTFAGKVGIFTESAESVWSVRNPCGTPGGV